MKLARNLSIFLACLLASSCSNQNMDKDGGDLLRGEVEFLSRNMSQAIEKNYPLLKHRVVNRYIDNLGQYIISRNPEMPPLPYEFRVLKTNDIGVFSLPGGLVYITLGAIRSMEIEGQLASAISHELAHQQLNHSLITWRRKVNAKRGQRYVLNFDGDFNELFLGNEGALRYGEGMETEADQLAPIILYRAKFDPRVYPSYLELLKKIQNKNANSLTTILVVHPPIEKREAWVKDALVKIPPFKDPRLSTQSFDEIKQILKNAESRSKGKEKGSKYE